jgi:hypothetical protein
MSKKLHLVRKPLGKARRRRAVPLRLEALEERYVLDVRSITGFGNNLVNPTWGAAGTDLLRVSPAAYANGTNSPSTPNTLSPRQISNDLNNQSSPIFSGADNLGSPQSRSLSDFAYVWGQFIDHDMDLTPTQSGPNAETFNVPADPKRLNDGMGIEPFIRSVFDPNTGTTDPRQQINADTSYLDLSQVYGSTQFVADALRVQSPDGSLGAHLKTSPGDLLPFDRAPYFNPAQVAALNMANDAQQVPEGDLFAAGDVRANENIELTAITTLFVRNHNHLVDQLHALNPTWSDEHLYQEARKLNIAEEEIITYTEFLPAILGPNALPAYAGYNPNVNAGIATEFSTVGFRFGHSLLSNTVGRNNNNGTDIADVNPNGAGVNLAEDFFRPDLINPNGATVDILNPNGTIDPHTSSGIGAILKADADNAANETDLLLIDEVRNVLFGIPNAPGTDLAARDVQRARDDGIGTYNQVRVAYGLPAVTKFSDITSNVAVQNELQATYGTVDNIDPFEGMLAEDHLAGADVGPTIKAILGKQFAALRDGDRFFYLNEGFNAQELSLLQQGNTLAKVIDHNTAISNLQGNVFFFKESISGTVFDDDDLTNVFDPDDVGVANVTVNLLDDSGKVVASTTTDSHGNYSFTDQTGIPGTGKFSVSVVVPAGYKNLTPTTIATPLSRGGLDFDNMNFAIDETDPGGAAPALSGGGLTSTGGSLAAPAALGASGALAPSVGGSSVSVGAPARPPSSANVVTISGSAATSSQVTAVLAQPSTADSSLALPGAADQGAAPVDDLNGPGVTVL